MAQKDLNEKILELGKAGQLTYEMLNKILPEEYNDPDKIEEIFDLLESYGIELKDMDPYEREEYIEKKVHDKIRELSTFAEGELTEEETISEPGSEELLSLYLKEMGKYDLLTPEREEELSREIREGFDNILKIIRETQIDCKEILEVKAVVQEWERRDPNLKPKKTYVNYLEKVVKELEERYIKNKKHKVEPKGIKEFCTEIKKNIARIEKAKDEMVKANLRLVVSIAKKYVRQGLSLADLIQEGNLGLMRAVYRFDYRKGNKFSTYASWWIRQSITRAILDKTRTIRLPVHFLELRNYVFKVFYELSKELGREPTPEELSQRTGVPYEKILVIFETSKEPVSLETPIGDEDSTLGNFIENKKSPSPYDTARKKDISEKIKRFLATLSPREEKIIRMRFGLGEYEGYTLEEIGYMFKVSRERIRQIEKKALYKMRQLAQKEKFDIRD
ncbi:MULTISPECIES: sigma-70 family RNA polymerase sigma factor [Thermodesulfobacterium]|jgi:RNA polymerase primary sigma factor|uniref:RNA polymerase sigma factor n=1 Tax=Thermodesulfobacterium commune DSM 2178 TaxID=289377 RepID=A0A075WQS4_9BACT|nr:MULTISPECIES: sigma-70 family RNA polymerase sigma factor [Thermodesulfobacterium]HCE80032.1 RNA polymerase subunit sigma [Thermodesulfobacterium commune]AIH03659.1 RNA polymerase sigma factor [Thermodesulfobacterium commune DSM 2178]MBZ4681903.1 polymerase sigma factor [Thermodesulfobacterium sp.]MDK2861019.1 polymerase primary sigma factor [Thermodesulfobacterium sp.]MDN5379442.1 polymerase primary sigma factor [Thermodesulfobacterium sp.]